MIDALAPADFDAETVFDSRGRPMINDFAQALSIWRCCQSKHPVTVEDAAEAFNATPEVIREAVEHHPWLSVFADEIEPEGA